MPLLTMKERTDQFIELLKKTYMSSGRVFDEVATMMLSVQDAKGRDYGEEEDGLKNLRRRGEVGILGRMEDKIMRLGNLAAKEEDPAVKDESFEDTCIDFANYAILLIILRRWKKSIESGEMTL